MFVKKRKLLSSSNILLFGPEVLKSLILSLEGWWGCGWVVFLAKGTTSRHWFFLFQIKNKTKWPRQVRELILDSNSEIFDF